MAAERNTPSWPSILYRDEAEAEWTAASLARRGRVAVIDPGGGSLRRQALERLAIPTDQIIVVTPEPLGVRSPRRLTRELHAEASEWAGVLLVDVLALRGALVDRLIGAKSPGRAGLEDSDTVAERRDAAMLRSGVQLQECLLGLAELPIQFVATAPDPLTQPGIVRSLVRTFPVEITMDGSAGRLTRDRTTSLPEELLDPGADHILELVA